MLVVPLACPHCGAQGRHLEGSLLAVCAYCGAVIAQHREAIGGAVEAVRRAYRNFVAPDARDARCAVLDGVVRTALAAGDREQWYAASLELALIRIAERPGDVPVTSGAATWARHQVAVREIATWNPIATLPQLVLADVERDPAGAATAQLAACRRFAQAALDDPRYPVELRAVTGGETLAVDCLRVQLAGAAPQLSAVALLAAHEAIGTAAAAAHNCAVCGGRCEAADVACPWCRAAIDREAEHPWVAGLARIAEAPLAVERRPAQRAAIALGPVATNARFTAKPPIAPLVIAYLRRVVPDLEREALVGALDLLAHAFPELAALRPALAGWRATAAPPPPHAAPTVATIDEAWEDPWVVAQLATWQQVGAPRDPMAVAAIALLAHGLGVPVAPAQVAAFVVRTAVNAIDVAAALELRGATEAAALVRTDMRTGTSR